MKRLVKFIRLPAFEKKVFFQAVYYHMLFRIRLITTSPQTLFRSVSKKSTFSKCSMLLDIQSRRIAGIINAAGNVIPATTCLSKALAGYVILNRYGYQAKLHIGVSQDKERMLEAHAWLSLNGDIILGRVPDLERFRELPLDCVQGFS